ncbi:unnamed protein product [Candidula unifasciata]|uniref:Nuclear hormone receptor HR96 n=1 Tax=Candidula unifasciata TaxID=100452 RepID=A0A8S3ZXX1_9EUPU|nr:unnamed protein product [Candidula unifasciata]
MVVVNSSSADANSGPHRSPSQSKREQKRRPKPKDGSVLLCGVCGDRALGYNFDAVSCESCKAFFRRNALKTKPFTCSFEGNCKMDPHTRKFCSGCRLKKCFTIGMKKDWILSEDQLVKRRQRQHTKQVHSTGSSSSDAQFCSSTSNDMLGDDSSTPYSQRDYQMSTFPNHQRLPSSTCGSDSGDYMPLTPAGYYEPCSSTTPSPLKHHYSYEGSLSPTSTTSPPSYMPHLLPVPQSSQQISSIPSLTTGRQSKMEYSSEDDDGYYQNISQVPVVITPLHDPVGSSDDLAGCSIVKSEAMEDTEDYIIPLSPHIKATLQDLARTYDEIFEAAYTQDQTSKLTEKPKTANQLFNMTDVFIRRLIRFAKHIPEFKALSQSDQIHLLKGGIMEMFVLRSAMGFDSKNNGWKFKFQQSSEPNAPKGEGKLDSTVINTLGSSMFMQHMNFVRQLQEISGNNRTVLMLLFIIDLMSPDRANLTDKQKVSQSQERHSLWLKAYLESVHTVAEAKVIYPKLLVKLLDVRDLGEESCHMASTLDITNLEPLLVEVFDLK